MTPASIAETASLLTAQGYIADRQLATTVHLALAMQRPLFLEGEPGTGKTEIAKVLAAGLGRRLVRLQCYDGLDLAASAYEWDHASQLMAIRLAEASGDAGQAGRQHLQQRVPAAPPAALRHRSGPAAGGAADRRAGPRRRAVRGLPARAVGRLPAQHPAIRRGAGEGERRWWCSPPTAPARCTTRSAAAACTIGWNTPTQRVKRRFSASRPLAWTRKLSAEVVAFVQRVRGADMFKPPGVAETIDWALALAALDQRGLSEQVVEDTLGVLLKYQDDIAALQAAGLAARVAQAKSEARIAL